MIALIKQRLAATANAAFFYLKFSELLKQGEGFFVYRNMEEN